MSTNNNIRNQNKQVKAQHKYDKKYWKYENEQREDSYEDSRAIVEANRENNQAQVDAQQQTADQNWQYGMDVRDQQFEVEKDAYKQSIKDYRKQKGFNKQAARLSTSMENRRAEEALIQKNFAISDENIKLGRSRYAKDWEVADQRRERAFVKAETKLDIDHARDTAKLQNRMANNKYDELAKDIDLQKDISNLERQDINYDTDRNLEQLDEKNAQLNRDIHLSTRQEVWDGSKIGLKYDRAHADNMYARMDAMVEKSRAIGAARAAGREGTSAQAEQQSVLAEYGRAQAQLVDNLVFDRTDEQIASSENVGTKAHQRRSLQSQQKINSIEKLRVDSKRNFAISKSLVEDQRLDNKKEYARKERNTTIKMNNLNKSHTVSKLENALANTKQKIDNNIAKARQEFKFDKTQISADKNKIRMTYQSTKQDVAFQKQQIKLDKYGANLAAQANIRAKPKYPVALPTPVEIPRTKFPMPTEPLTPPKPIKGALGKTSWINTVGDVANTALSILNPF